jgi:hypothetical protein
MKARIMEVRVLSGREGGMMLLLGMRERIR